MNIEGVLLASHFHQITQRGLYVEFELSTTMGWSNLHVFFPYQAIMYMVSPSKGNVRACTKKDIGVYSSEASRVVLVVFDENAAYTMSEQDMAFCLFKQLH